LGPDRDKKTTPGHQGQYNTQLRISQGEMLAILNFQFPIFNIISLKIQNLSRLTWFKRNGKEKSGAGAFGRFEPNFTAMGGKQGTRDK